MASCYYTYTGIYFLDRSDNLTPARAEEIGHGMAGVVDGYGFALQKGTEGNPMLSFASGQRAISPALRSLSGSDARITIAVRLDRPSITLRDHSNSKETDFVKSLKMQIEGYLVQQGVVGASFERQSDFLFR
jgi:hypothetical protein